MGVNLSRGPIQWNGGGGKRPEAVFFAIHCGER